MEENLKKGISNVFHNMLKDILNNIDEYWENLQFQGQIDLILAPIHENHKLYNDTLYYYIEKAYNQGYSHGENLTRTKIQNMVTKADYIENIKFSHSSLFGTIDQSREKLQNQTFRASEKTLSRVDSEINNILSQGYSEGVGSAEIGRRLTKKFTALEGWESERIARTEIHHAQAEGMMKSYRDMDVQYIMWNTHIDERTRSTHIDLDGEIIPFDGTFSNGLRYPGDKNGPISEWIHCRCTPSPYLIPLDKIAPPEMGRFRESDLINYNKTKTSISQQVKINSYGLSSDEQREYELLIKKLGTNKLKFKEKRKYKYLKSKLEFNQLHQKKVSSSLTKDELTKYNKLYEKFGQIEDFASNNSKNNYWRYSEEDDILKKKLRKKSQEIGLSTQEREKVKELIDKRTFTSLYDKTLEGRLSYNDSKKFINLRNKYNWSNLPDLDKSKLTPISDLRQSKLTNFYGEVRSISSKYKLSTSEENQLNELLFKRLLNQGRLNSSDRLKLEYLYNKKQFNYLYSLNQQNKGLNWEGYSKFKKLFNKLKTNLNLDEKILEIPLSKYKSKIPLDTKASKFEKIKGVSDEGLLPNGRDIDDYFTIDARNMTPREKQVADRWLGSHYRFFTDYEITCQRDVKKFTKYILETVEGDYEYYPTLKRAENLAKSIAHDIKTLDDILNNQMRKNMAVWRVQENHYLGDNPKVGDIITFPNFRSTAISKEGALWFSKTNSKPMKYLIEIEAPAGTKGAYLAPIKKGEIINPDSPYHGEHFAREMEFLLKESKMEIIEFNDKTVTGAMGEELIHIKLKVIG